MKIACAFQQIRQKTLALCQPLFVEDYVIQGMEDVSPPKWHLAHTTWFYETFILAVYQKNYQLFNKNFSALFNSYYQSLGTPFLRPHRGLLSRPTVAEIIDYRKYVDDAMLALLESSSGENAAKIAENLILGLNHEQQHQELLLMDIKYNFSLDPTLPAYQKKILPCGSRIENADFSVVNGGLVNLGYSGSDFCFDNELPAHSFFLKPYLIQSRLTTNRQFLEFIEDGGYQNPQWWLADGWEAAQGQHWTAPLYWLKDLNRWQIFTLNGLIPLNLEEPVCHVSFYEADAFARWSGKRLPTEAEWENYFNLTHLNKSNHANMLESGWLHPICSEAEQLFGDVWEWTDSAYCAYPGFKPLTSPFGEYNGKFMSNKKVLRGGSCVTPKDHIRNTYRNFYALDKRWQFSGIRLAANSGGI